MKNSRDLILGEVVYIAIIYNILDSWIFLLNAYNFYFVHMTGENREYGNFAQIIFSSKINKPFPGSLTFLEVGVDVLKLFRSFDKKCKACIED